LAEIKRKEEEEKQAQDEKKRALDEAKKVTLYSIHLF